METNTKKSFRQRP